MTPSGGSTGDLGRRIAHRRESLGLSREELADRTGMATGYLEYLERTPATLDRGTLLRLARALDTTAEDLLGGGLDRPPGSGRPPRHPVLETLDSDECLRLISPGGVGRVAFVGASGLAVLPVNYTMYERSILFRTRLGGAMDEDLRTGVAGVELAIAFEVDRIDEASRAGWSVLVQGAAHHVPPDETAEVAGAYVEPWAGGERELYVRVTPLRVTGRRIHGF
ncbi:pyridoxamine 5'-phosphate oxidase family protein [Sphaerisporangium sp. B11E5]|uniref:pyridoxamine 5'-phosphate oxidase family protein n=1 Tax=Sphaerisporangium sp. B11E5 TaxID=3153563 RepID=UPI00325F67B6